ncbi:MAG: penicillin-binding protein, partial [Lachnospiraceae bacterium]|nr:penicillin-binding protein [Candidatus Colinaster equi]
MFRKNNENFINSIFGRTLFLSIVIAVFAAVLLVRIFTLQIVNGEETLSEFTLKIQKERTIPSTRGKIYDRNGKLLAYNELAYNVMIEDVYESGRKRNSELNSTILKLIKIIENNGDKIIGDFNIIINENNEYEFTISDSKLKRFLADVYGRKSVGELKYEEETATADDVINYLCGYSKFGIGESLDPENPKDSFVVGKGYSKSQILKLINVRYAMSLNSYQKYIPTIVAADVKEETVAIIMENRENLLGISIEEDNIRKYNNSVYFSGILGYTGKISEEELNTYNNMPPNLETVKQRSDYYMNDMVGKAGIEQTLETYLQGIKGNETVYVNNLGKVIESTKTVDPIAGNDVYLTIDSDLQIAAYNILEQKLAGILVSKIQNIREYNPPEGTPASKYLIPITDVYFALINNSVIDINHFYSNDANENEKAVYSTFCNKKTNVFEYLKTQLTSVNTPYKDLSTEYQVYESYIVTMLNEKGVILDSEINKNDETYIAWKTDETISLGEFLKYCISQNWIDVSKIELNTKYSDSDEIYN